MSLVTTPNLVDRDGVDAALVEAHRGLDEHQSAALNARLILILVNHIGDSGVIADAIALAQEAGSAPDPV